MLSYPSVHGASPRDRILIVAPHMDDETIGAGGYAIDALRRGAEVYVVFLTAGDRARLATRLMHRKVDPAPADYLSVGRARIEEAADAMAILGVPRERWFVLGYPDHGLRSLLARPTEVIRSTATGKTAVPYDEALSPGADYTLENLMADLRIVITRCNPTTVIAPVNFDVHPDHSATSDLLDMVLDETTTRLGYLVHSNGIKPLLWQRDRAVVPPPETRSYAWASYGVSMDARHVKYEMLQAYRSQRPYSILLRNAFVRSNELFFAYAPMSVQVEHAPIDACAPYSQPSSY
jgi:LmbE family N-acetylglucosaminyl deacetylase